jgi:hypothetical protein
MIYAMASDIASRLVARGFPVEVRYGVDRLSSAVGVADRRIVVERDRRGGDTFSPYPGGRGNPRAVGVRGVGVTATVLARSPKRGALLHDHEHDCDQLVDALLVELREWCAEAKAGEPEIVEGRLLGPQDFLGEVPPEGAAYQLRFRVSRATLCRDYEGDAEPTGALAGTGVEFSAVRVSRDGSTYETVPLGGEDED